MRESLGGALAAHRKRVKSRSTLTGIIDSSALKKRILKPKTRTKTYGGERPEPKREVKVVRPKSDRGKKLSASEKRRRRKRRKAAQKSKKRNR